MHRAYRARTSILLTKSEGIWSKLSPVNGSRRTSKSLFSCSSSAFRGSEFSVASWRIEEEVESRSSNENLVKSYLKHSYDPKDRFNRALGAGYWKPMCSIFCECENVF